MKRTAFSLVELSIVLVILGLLTGGILAGQSLIRAAELRAVTTEYNRYYTAAQAFKDKYFAIPGDFDSATRFWGRLNSNADCVTNSSAAVATPGTCDGNNDRIMNGTNTASASLEAFQFWRQLALAGLIEGNYSGLVGAGGTSNAIPGTNVPISKLSGGSWGAWYTGVYAGGTNYYGLDYGNEFFFGSTIINGLNSGAILKPQEIWNIDTKMDDGKPGTGKVIAGDVAGFGTATACTTSASGTDFTGTYNLGNSTVSCNLYFVRAF